MYKVVCDGPNCKYATIDVSEYECWTEAGHAEDEWREAGLQVTEDGKHYCDHHRLPECADCDRTDNLVNDEPGDTGDWWCPEHLETAPEHEAPAGVVL
jgi:hypothetical protein